MLTKLYTFLIILYPFFYTYATPLATLSVGDLLLITLLFLMTLDIVKNNKYDLKRHLSKFWFFLVVYTILEFLIIAYSASLTSVISLLLPTCRLLVYFFTVAVYSKYFFDCKLGLSIYKYSATISSVFLILQIFCLNLFGKYIPGTIPGLPLLNESLGEFNEMMISGDIGHRARSFFSEPSYFAIYVVLYLCFELLVLKRKNYKVITIITLALLLSGSSTAILMTALVYLLWFITNSKKLHKKTLMIMLMGLVSLAMIFPFYIQTESFQTFYTRTFVDKDATEGRFGTYDDIFINPEDSIQEKIFGRGIKKIEDMYIAGLPRIYYYYGYFGIFILSICSIYYLFKLKGLGFYSLLMLIVFSFATEMLFSYMILIYGTFLFYNFEKENDKYAT